MCAPTWGIPFELFERLKVYLVRQGVSLVAISFHWNDVEFKALRGSTTLRHRPTGRLRSIRHMRRGGADLLSKQPLPVEEGKHSSCFSCLRTTRIHSYFEVWVLLTFYCSFSRAEERSAVGGAQLSLGSTSERSHVAVKRDPISSRRRPEALQYTASATHQAYIAFKHLSTGAVTFDVHYRVPPTPNRVQDLAMIVFCSENRMPL